MSVAMVELSPRVVGLMRSLYLDVGPEPALDTIQLDRALDQLIELELIGYVGRHPTLTPAGLAYCRRLFPRRIA